MGVVSFLLQKTGITGKFFSSITQTPKSRVKICTRNIARYLRITIETEMFVIL